MKTFSIQSLYNWYREMIRHPKWRWAIIGASLLYLLSPLDISPDVFPIVGWIDDGVIATLLVAEISQMLLERLKVKGQRSGQASTPEVESTLGATAVDVDAVPVK